MVKVFSTPQTKVVQCSGDGHRLDAWLNAQIMLTKAYLLVVESRSLHIGFFYRNNEGNIYISSCCCSCCKLFKLLFMKRHFTLHTHTSLPLFFEIFRKPRCFGFSRKVTLPRQGTVDKISHLIPWECYIKSFYNLIALSWQYLVLFRSWLQIYNCNCFMNTTTTFPIKFDEKTWNNQADFQ